MDATGRLVGGRTSLVYFHSLGTESEHSTTLRLQITRNLDAGVVYALDMRKANPLANWRFAAETKTRPAFSLGLGTDRLGSMGEAAFFMASKNLAPWLETPASAYLGVGYSRNHRLFPVGGGAVRISKNVTGSLQFDGSDFHPALGVQLSSLRVAIVAVKGREFGFNVGIAR